MKRRTFCLEYSVYPSDGEGLTSLDLELVERAKAATQRSYSPYSSFRVGAAVLLENGEIVIGSNQENAAYSPTMCAERTALFYANTMYPDSAPVALAVAAWRCSDERFLPLPISPCGVCRQVFVEQETRYGRSLRVLLYGEEAIYEVASASDLLPLQFSNEALE